MSLPELLIRPDLPKRAYRLKCRFTTGAGVSEHSDAFIRVRNEVAWRWVVDMEKQGWKYDPNKYEPSARGFTCTGPYPVTPVTGVPKFHQRKKYTSKEMYARVMAGDPCRDEGQDWVVPVLGVHESDKWDWELTAVFIRTMILTEIPEAHELRKF
jgi:hypothetical protein